MVNASQERILELVGLIYEAAADPSCWPAFLDRWAETIGSNEALFLVHDLSRREASFAIDTRVHPDYKRLYAEYYGGMNQWIVNGPHLLETGVIIVGSMMCPDEVLHASEFYNDYLAKMNMHDTHGVTLIKDGTTVSYLTTMRSKDQPRFGVDEMDLLRILVPHLQRAVQLHQRIQGMETRLTAANDALDRIPVGFVLIGASGKVLSFNRPARAIFDKRDGLTVTPTGLAAALSNETGALRRCIEGAIATAKGKGLAAGGAMTLSRPSLARPLSVMVIPLRPDPMLLIPDPPAAAVFVSDPEAVIEPSDQMIRRLFGLTPTEARVAAALMQGRSLEKAAEELGTSIGTMRTHLKRIFSKTGTNRQGELVRLLLTSLAHLKFHIK